MADVTKSMSLAMARAAEQQEEGCIELKNISSGEDAFLSYDDEAWAWHDFEAQKLAPLGAFA